jgi:hypothetical protein
VPARPFDKVRLSLDKMFVSGEGKMKSGARRDVGPGRTAFSHSLK